VKGAAIDASASLRLSPTSATFNAAQSFAPSPHMATVCPVNSCKLSTRKAFPSGLILAKILALEMTAWIVSISFYSFINSKAAPVIATS
jgi:hypothetical protein